MVLGRKSRSRDRQFGVDFEEVVVERGG